jgi:D-amino-acid dehydrogenase
MFKKNAPLFIKPRFDPSLWLWLLKFAGRCNEAAMMESAHACQELLRSSQILYTRLMASEPLECELQSRGLLFVFAKHEEMEEYAKTDRLLTESFGMPAIRYDDNAVARLEPALKPDLAGGWYYEHDSHLRPDKLMASWAQLLKKLGVTIREQCEATGFVRDGNRSKAITTSTGEVAADAFVIAAGALTPMLAKFLGCSIPIQPGKGYSITMPRPKLCPKIPLIFPETKVAVTPMRSGYRLGSTMEFAGYDATLNRARLDMLKEGAKPYLIEPFNDLVQQEWFGWRPMTYDGKPIIDRSPVMENVVIAAGHNMLGLSMSPATGRLVAEILNGTPPHINPQPFSVRRF